MSKGKTYPDSQLNYRWQEKYFKEGSIAMPNEQQRQDLKEDRTIVDWSA